MAVSFAGLERASAAYRAAEADLTEARAELRREIVRTRKAGASMRAIGEVIGVSRQRVREILRDEGAVAPPSPAQKRSA